MSYLGSGTARVKVPIPRVRVGTTVSTGEHGPTIRPASGEDLDDLQALARRTIDTCHRVFLSDEGVDRFIGSGASDAHVKNHLERGGVHCLISHEGRTIGFSILDGPTIDLMMVDPDHHRQGLGRLLLQHAEPALLAQYSTIRPESFADNAAANSFYEACGWLRGDQPTGEGPAKFEYVKRAAAGATDGRSYTGSGSIGSADDGA